MNAAPLAHTHASRLWPLTWLACSAATFAACAVSAPPRASDDPPNTHPLPERDASASADASADGCTDSNGCTAVVDCTTVDFCATPFPVSRLVALNAIWGSGPNDVWAVGSRGTILHGDGSTFVAIDSKTVADVHVAVWGTSKTDVWILGPSFPAHSDGFQDGGADFAPRPGSSWTPAQATSGRLWAGQSVGDKVWIAGEASRRFGASSSVWTLDDDGSGSAAWMSISACSENAPCAPAIRAMWAASAELVWAVGHDGQAFSFDAATGGDAGPARWLAQNSNTRDDLEAVWGSGPSDVWAVGRRGTIRRTSRGTAKWTVVPSGTTRDLHAIWGSGPDDIWAAGDSGTILHYDGVSWAPATLGLPSGDSPTNLLAIWGSGPDDIWIVGEGLILHRGASSRRRP